MILVVILAATLDDLAATLDVILTVVLHDLFFLCEFFKPSKRGRNLEGHSPRIRNFAGKISGVWGVPQQAVYGWPHMKIRKISEGKFYGFLGVDIHIHCLRRAKSYRF